MSTASPPRGPDIDGLVFVEHLGEGGYSDVFLYERRSPRMKVAVKILKDIRLSEAEHRQFEAEAEAMAELADHPYIVQVFSADTTEDGRPYLVMKFYPGPNLAKRAAQSRLSVAEVLRTGVKISGAVETAHRAGIIHRDIKPANVLVSPYGEPGLTDFGIAGRVADTSADDVGVSIPWSPPEVLDGTSNGSVQADVYSLAATVWHLLVGRSPFEVPHGDNSQLALTQRVLRTPPPPTGRAEAPATLDRLLLQAMAKSPANRPRTALEFAQALQSVEQELRFARTEIVVPGLELAGDLATRPSDVDGPDRTRLKAPQRVIGQRAPSAGSRFAPSAPAVEPATGRRPAAPIAEVPPPLAASPTGRRAAISTPPTAPAQRARHASPRAESPATVLRPARPSESDPATEAPRRGIRPKYALIVAAAIFLVAAVIGIVLTSRGSGKPQATDTFTNGASNQDIGNTDLQQPVVSARYDAKAKVVHFTWTPSKSHNIVYEYFVGRSFDHPVRTDKPAVDIHTSTPARTCISVRVREIGTSFSSAASDLTCGA